ncbi:cyclodeaminase/cyclohydrolase family protein [Pseudonocardia sp.]|uniref:cyclodeaminase/cyclohydrolase family protein n=1 Tax=Pseudonocardia sp. TaxID=60912 RepID=UPI0031FD6AD7
MMTTFTALAGSTVGAVADAVASDSPTPGGGAVAALTAGLAAALAAMASRYALGRPRSEALPDVGGLVARMDEQQLRALRLADEDVHTYQGYIAIRLPHEPDPAPRRAALSTALDASAEVPLALTRWAQAAAAARRVGLPYDHLPDRDEES